MGMKSYILWRHSCSLEVFNIPEFLNVIILLYVLLSLNNLLFFVSLIWVYIHSMMSLYLSLIFECVTYILLYFHFSSLLNWVNFFLYLTVVLFLYFFKFFIIDIIQFILIIYRENTDKKIFNKSGFF